MFEFFILFVASFLSLVIGVSVFIKNPKSATSKLFFYLTQTLIFWSIVNYILDQDISDSASLFFLKLNFVSVVIQNTLFYLFSTVFPDSKYVFKLRHKIFICYTVFVLMLVASGNVISGFEDGNPIPVTGIIFFILHAILSVVGGFRRLYIRHRLQKAGETNISFLIYGSMILWFVVPITNFILPNVFEIYSFVKYSALYVLVFSALISYAVLRQKLFDLQLVVARATAYLLSIIIIVAVFVMAILTVAGRSVVTGNTTQQRLIFVTLAIIAAILYPSIRRYSDRLTNSIFYRDAYDPQELMDSLNDRFVNTLDLHKLLHETAELIQSSIKVAHVTFYIHPTAYFRSRIVSTKPSIVDSKSLKSLANQAVDLNSKVINIESETEKSKSPSLEAAMRDNGSDILVRLTSTGEFKVTGTGIMLIGPKQSGGFFNQQDMRTFEIISNELVIAIENVLKHEEIEQFNVTLQKGIDGATKELRESNSKLLELDEAKDEFVTMASHQLRTPLTSIKGYISMVLEGDAGKVTPKQELMLKQAFSSSQRMVYLISDLLNVSRLKTGKFNIEAKPVNLVNMIEGELLQMADAASAKKVKIEFKKPNNFPNVDMDELKTRQVVMNFIDNAIFYTPKGGKITIEAQNNKDSISCIVKDNGIGVPENQKDRLFTKFYRADNARKARPDGTGLGLFMAKKVIEAQKGELIFESKINKGSTFGFTLPKKIGVVKS